mmetsp:Transcript_32271/g.108709  ORF Transcript_32271/g.108709 Transcript_32271/m.108709 type:complete len:202 (-) Transcript_32271:847-1452(-)
MVISGASAWSTRRTRASMLEMAKRAVCAAGTAPGAKTATVMPPCGMMGSTELETTRSRVASTPQSLATCGTVRASRGTQSKSSHSAASVVAMTRRTRWRSQARKARVGASSRSTSPSTTTPQTTPPRRRRHRENAVTRGRSRWRFEATTSSSMCAAPRASVTCSTAATDAAVFSSASGSSSGCSRIHASSSAAVRSPVPVK